MSSRSRRVVHHSITWLWLLIGVAGILALGWSLWGPTIAKAMTQPQIQSSAVQSQTKTPPPKLFSLKSASAQEQLDKLEVANAWVDLVGGGLEKLFAIGAGIVGIWQFLKRKKGDRKP